mgnify:CR=1 FL=1
MRNDLESLGFGRASAQASHAANAFIHKYGKRADVKEWQNQTKQGFGTAIVLAINNVGTIGEIEACAKRKKFLFEKVIDPDYRIVTTLEISYLLSHSGDTPYTFDYLEDGKVSISRKEMTCAYVFGTKEDLDPYLSDLPLYG